jgi:hypothetical protein
MPQAFRGEGLAVRPKGKDGFVDVCFEAHKSPRWTLTNPSAMSADSCQPCPQAEHFTGEGPINQFVTLANSFRGPIVVKANFT